MSGESATSARVLLAAASISGMKTGILFEFKSNIERSFRIPMGIVFFSNRQEKDYNYHYKMNKTLNPYQRLTNRPSRSIKGWFWSIRVGLLSSFSLIKAEQGSGPEKSTLRGPIRDRLIGPPIPARAHLV